MDRLARIAMAELRGAVYLIRAEGPLFWLRWFGPTPSARRLRRDAERADAASTRVADLDGLAQLARRQREVARWQ